MSKKKGTEKRPNTTTSSVTASWRTEHQNILSKGRTKPEKSTINKLFFNRNGTNKLAEVSFLCETKRYEETGRSLGRTNMLTERMWNFKFRWCNKVFDFLTSISNRKTIDAASYWDKKTWLTRTSITHWAKCIWPKKEKKGIQNWTHKLKPKRKKLEKNQVNENPEKQLQ